MRVAAHLYTYPPMRLLGAELMTSELLEALAEQGHECRVATIANVDPYRRNRVDVSGRLIDVLASPDDRFDVFVTHPELAEFNHDRARGCGSKVVHIVHNLRDETLRGIENHTPDLLIANGVETQRALAARGFESMVVRPPTKEHPPRLHLEPQATTLVNLSPEKGGHMLAFLADERPHRKFLGVVGGYAGQVLDQPANVAIMGQSDAMWIILGLTRVLLMPSTTETWGRVACEALALGIPVLASDLPALRESLGEGATFLEPDDPQAWLAALRDLDDPLTYEAASFRATTRGAELLDLTQRDLERWVDAVEGL